MHAIDDGLAAAGLLTNVVGTFGRLRADAVQRCRPQHENTSEISSPPFTLQVGDRNPLGLQLLSNRLTRKKSQEDIPRGCDWLARRRLSGSLNTVDARGIFAC